MDACVSEVRPSKAADVINGVAEKVDFEDFEAGVLEGPQDGDCRLLEGADLAAECRKTMCCSLGEGAVLHAGEEMV